ncbi:hypothetical protein SAMN02949497_1671 [Methylomagnum ishizawai]|uniref:Calx-beta domain-containing protein n=1 Tax=Methylomagnum ishizawai TaxID=1760988 RepID=A0A1Y6CVV2_9GAMM|nr:hypothetical protein [Methylomagnum ishizawai]SMF94360.1 hypothetical protein SAMN02949497_1671 [Methylomagnum ishizawai]
MGCSIGTASATGTIRNDDCSLSIAATDADKFEGDDGATDFTFTVTRTGPTTSDVSVDWAVSGSGGNPATGADFVGGAFPAGTLTIPAGQTSGVIAVQVQGDTDVEPDQGFTVTISNPVLG